MAAPVLPTNPTNITEDQSPRRSSVLYRYSSGARSTESGEHRASTETRAMTEPTAPAAPGATTAVAPHSTAVHSTAPHSSAGAVLYGPNGRALHVELY